MPTLYFYAKDEPFGEFSNFAAFGIEMDGKWWPTVEHYFQAQKFSNEAYREKIRKTLAPKAAANLGRSRKLPIRPDWEEVKEEIMRAAVRQKFQTHEKLRQLLLSTEDAVLVENSPNDYFWGGGQNGTGENRLGQILMQVRSLLRK